MWSAPSPGWYKEVTAQRPCKFKSYSSYYFIFNFDNEYKVVAKELNILLAPRDDPEKSFAPCKEGCVYGIHYNTRQQTWWMSEEKIAMLQGQLMEVLYASEVEQQKI